MDGISSIDSVVGVVSTLGAYFSIILVLSVVVETILSSLKQNGWLNRRVQSHQWLSFLDVAKTTVSPDQAMRDIAYWVPAKSQAEVQIAALNNMARQFPAALDEVTRGADAALDMTNELIALTGMTRHAAVTRTQLAEKLYSIRQKYNASEAERIGRLRRVSAALGILIALLFQLDTFGFLQPLFAPSIQHWVNTPYMGFAGMILTGAAASAGSSFWHDQLDRVRAVKESARTLQSLTTRVY